MWVSWGTTSLQHGPELEAERDEARVRREPGLDDSKLVWFSREREDWKPQLVLSRKGLLQPVGKTERRAEVGREDRIGGCWSHAGKTGGRRDGEQWGTRGTFGGETHSWGLDIAAEGGEEAT